MKCYKNGEKLYDGSTIKKLYFFNYEKGFIIFLNQNKEVKYRIVNKLGYSFKIDLPILQFIENDILEIPNFFRKDLNLSLAYYFSKGILRDNENKEIIEEQQEKMTIALKEMQIKIIERKKFLKKLIYLVTPLLLGTSMSLIAFISKFNFDLILFSSIGSFILNFKNINKIEFDSSEVVSSYILFSILKYCQSIICSYLLVYLYKSKIINITTTVEKDKFINILYILGSFSENLVPNIFSKFESKIKVDE